MSWYKTGTLSLTNGSTAVTGSGTAFIANAAAGEALLAPDGKYYEIAAVVSDTSLTLGSNYLGTTASGQAYTILPSQSFVRDLAAQAAALIQTYADIATGAGAGKFSAGTVSLPGIAGSADTDTGINLAGSNVLNLVAGGAARVAVTTAGAAVTGTLSTSGNATLGDSSSADSHTVNGIAAISANSASTALTITQTGSGNALLIEDVASDASPFVIDGAGRVMIGKTVADSTDGTSLNVYSAAQYYPQPVITNDFDGTGGSYLMFKRRRGANAMQENDGIATIYFAGWDGAAMIASSTITAAIDGIPGTNDMPGRMMFSTTPDGSTSPSERMRIDSAGQTLITGYLRSTKDVRATGALMSATSPTNSNTTATATASSLIAGIRTGTPTAAIELQVPTGTSMDAAFQTLETNQSFEWSYINLATATHTCTITSNTDHILVGNMIVQPNSSGSFLTRKTATNTFTTYRIA